MVLTCRVRSSVALTSSWHQFWAAKCTEGRVLGADLRARGEQLPPRISHCPM